MYNKKILLEALKNLEKTKAPIKKKDISFDPTGKGMLNPIYAGKPVVLPTDTLYNPTPYTIKATSDNGIQKFLNPFDETNVHFPGASSIKEEPIMKKGGTKKFSKSLSATNKLLKKNPLFKKKNYKSKTYDPLAMYFQDGGLIPYDYNPYVSAEPPMEDIPKEVFQKGGTKMSQEEFEKRKAAYKKMTGRDFEPPKSFKQSPQAREYYQNRANQQPVIQSQPSETIQQSVGLPIEEETRRVQSKQIREQEEEKAKAAYLDRAAENYMKYHNDTYGSDYGFKTKEQALQEVSQSDFGGLEKYYNMYNPGPKNEELSAYEEQGMASRTWDVITNPFTAFKYSVQTEDFRNMPQYINKARMAGYDVDPDNLVGNAINTFANPFDVTDKVVRNTAAGDYEQAMLEALRMAPVPLAKYVPTVLRGANKFLSYAPIKQLPWLTGHGALNTHFAYETFKPEGFLDKSYQGFKEEDYGKGVENALWGTLGIAPFIRPGMQTVKAINELRTPGSMSIIPGAGKYSFAYKSPMESGLLVGNPNLGEAAPAFEKIVNPLSRFTKEAGLGEFKILKQNQAVSNVKPNVFLGDMTRAGQAVEVTTPALMENLPQQFTGSSNIPSPIDDVVKSFIKLDSERTLPVRAGLKNTTIEDEFSTLVEMNKISNGKGVVPVQSYANGKLILDDLVSKGYTEVDEFIKNKGKISESAIKELKDNLKLWHNNNIIHGDLKPNNAFYNPKTQEIKLIDPVGYPKDFKITNPKEYAEAVEKDINDFNRMFPDSPNAISPIDDIGRGLTNTEPIYRGVYINDEIRQLPKFKGKTDEEILDIMGTTIPGNTGTRRKGQLNQTLNFGRDYDSALEHIGKHTDASSIQRLGNTEDLTSGKMYVLKVQPDELSFLSAEQQKKLYEETIAAWKKNNPDAGFILGDDAKNLNPEILRQFGESSVYRTEGENVFTGNFPQFVGKENTKIGKLLESKEVTRQDYLNYIENLRKNSKPVNKDIFKLKPTSSNEYKPVEVPGQLPGSPNAVSSVDDVGRGLRNEKDPFLKTSGMSDYTDDVAVFSKNDNELAANIIDDIKNRKLELWKTPEGKRRLQKMIDNTPALKGETPESLSEAMEQVTNVNRTYSDKLKALDDIDSKKRQIEIAYAEGYLSVADYKIEINELDQKERILISNLKDIEIALKQYSGAFDLNTRTFEQGVRIQPGAFPLEELPITTSHELAHFLSSFKKVTPTYLDKQLEGLQLITDFSKQIKIPFAKTTPEKSSAYTVLKADKEDYLKEAVNYWNKGSQGTEKTSFLAEVREDMLQKGIIKSEHQPITNRMLKTHYENYKKAGDSKFPLRVYDIMQNKSENFNLLEKVINNLPVIIGGALAADSFMDENNSDLSEASVSALFAFLLKKPATSKFSKDLKSAFNLFKKGGLDALKPNHIKALKNEIKSIEAQKDALVTQRYGNISLSRTVDPNFKDRSLEGQLYDAKADLTRREDQLKSKLRKRDESVQEMLLRHKAVNLVNLRDKKANYELTNDGLTTSGERGETFSKTLSTGTNHVFDFISGAPVKVEVVLPKSVLKYSIDPKTGELVTSFDVIRQPMLTPEYIQSRKNSIAKVENDIPGAKVFGSTRLVTEAGMPHISDDIDLLILQSDYQKNVVGKYDFVQDYGPAKQHNIYPKYGEEGVLDFNIINENINGTVKPVFRKNPGIGEETSLEVELFRQFYPAEFFEASKKAIISGKPFEINMSAKDFMAGIDPGVKSVIDAYEASPTSKFGSYKPNKEKHTLRPDALISYGNPEIVAKGQEAFIKSLVGPKGTLGHQFPKEELYNVENNILTLMEMDYKGKDITAIAENPERMQLAINDFYINSTGFSREISAEFFPFQKYTEENITTAFTKWLPGKGSVNGLGLNTVQLGNPLHKDVFSDPVIGHIQLNINTNKENPLDYVKSINRATSGKYIFTPEELSIVHDIFSKYPSSSQVAGIKTSRDILELRPFGDQRDVKPAKDVAEKLGIRAIRKDRAPDAPEGQYGTSLYASILGNVDQTLDAMMYSFKKLHGAPKSKSERTHAFETQVVKPAATKTIETIKDFKQVSSLLDGGFERAVKRYEVLQNTISNLQKEKDLLVNKKTVKEKEQIKKIETLIENNSKEIELLSNQIGEIYKRIDRVSDIRNYLVLLGATTVGGVGISYGIKYIDANIRPNTNKSNAEKRRRDLKLQQGGTPSEIWKQHTGTSWSEAKRQGLTDGSAAQNIALANRVLAGEFGEPQISYEDYQNSRAAYDKMVVDKVMRGATLDDLVTQRVGTRSGLINRFPDLFNQQSPQQPKTLPDKPSAKKETTKRNSPVSVEETPVITPPVVKPQQQAPININELREKIKDLKRKNSMAGPTAMLRQYMKDPLKYAKELEALKNFNQVPKQSLHPSLYVDQSTFTPPGAMLPKVSAEVPSLSRRKEQQPIPGGIASKFSNTSTPGFINQDLLRFTEEKRQRDKEEAKGRIPYKEPSFVDGIFKAAGQTYTGGLDIEKGVDEMGVVMNEMGVVIDDYTRNFNSYFDRFLVKEGYKKPDSHVVQAKPTDKIKEVKPEVKNFYEQIEVTGDKHQKALPGSQLLSYRSQWDANKGFTFYNTEPKNKQRDVNKTYTDVEGVGHFILDASPLDGKTYMHPNNFAFINRAVESDNYIPMFESIPNSDGQVIMKYKKPSEMTEEELKALSIFNEYAERAAKAKNKSEKDQIAKEYAEAINYDKVKIVAPLRQYNFDDVDFNSSVKAPNFKQAKYLKTKDGKLTNLLFTDPAKNKYGRFDGVTVSFIFKDSYGNNIVRDFSGTINDIQKEGADIKTKYGLKDNELVIGYHDVGSFSAKPAAVNGKLSVNFFDGYNNDYGTGSALIIPKQK